MEKTGSGGETGSRTLRPESCMVSTSGQSIMGPGNLILPGLLTDSERPSNQPNGKAEGLNKSPQFQEFDLAPDGVNAL